MAPVINGFLCSNDRAAIGVKTFTVPGTGVLPGRMPVRLALRSDVAPLLLEYFRWFHAEIEPLDIPPLDDWGYAARAVRGSNSPSYHWAGIAGDGNALKHPLGVKGTFTADQRRRMKAKADTLGIRLGEFYASRVDGMHAEIIVPRERALLLVRALQTPVGSPPPPPPAAPPGGRPVLRLGSRHPAVATAQDALRRLGFYAPQRSDEVFGPIMERALVAFQRASGLTADGVLGAKTWTALLAPTAAPVVAPSGVRWPTLSRGAKHPAVGVFQRFRGLVADNDFGPRTQASAREYQTMQGLPVTGVLDAATWAATGL